MNGAVYALELDSSNNLYAGGTFTTAGGVSASNVAMWNGSAWSSLGSGVNGTVHALAVDSSNRLYAGGTFTTAGGVSASNVAMWNGSTWSSLGSGVNGTVHALAVDSSNNVYVAGNFNAAGGAQANYIAMWNGSSWSPLLSGGVNGLSGVAYALDVDPGSNTLYAGGNFFNAGAASSVNSVARWNGSFWSGLNMGLNSAVFALDFVSTTAVYAGGAFTQTMASSTLTPRIAQWGGTSWGSLGTGLVGGVVNALASDSGGHVYAGGQFTTAGSATANRVATWDGTSWSALGSGVSNGVNATVRALATDSSGNVYAGGDFTTAGGASANYIAKYSTLGPPPTVSSISPSSGARAGGTSVTITGTGFSSGASVTIGGVSATSVTVVSATQITAVTPAGGAASANVVVTNTDAQAGTLAGGFSYVPPTIASLSPASGSSAGGDTVTVTGTGFIAPVTVTVGGVSATGVTVSSQTSMSFTTPAGAAGAATVQIASVGQSATSSYTYVNSPSVSQSIAFGVLPNETYGAPAFTVAATATSGLPVTFTSMTTAVCTVSGVTVTIASTGSCTIRAEQPGDATYLAATPVDQSFTVSRAAQAPLTLTSTTGTAGTPLTLTTSGGTTGGAITYSVTGGTASACNEAGGVLTVSSAGTCTVTATMADDTNYLPVSTAATTVSFASPTPPGPGPVPPIPAPQPLPAPVPPGAGIVQIDGSPDSSAAITPNAGMDGLDITGASFSMRVRALMPDGSPALLDDSALVAYVDQRVEGAGDGLRPGTLAAVYLLNPVLTQGGGRSLPAPVRVGTVVVSGGGAFTGSWRLPSSVQPGEYVLQVVGTLVSGAMVTVDLGMTVRQVDRRAIIITGQRGAGPDRHAITVRGRTWDLNGERVTARVKLQGQTKYSTGSSRLVRLGEFTWQRTTGKKIYIYFNSSGVRSNRIIIDKAPPRAQSVSSRAWIP